MQLLTPAPAIPTPAPPRPGKWHNPLLSLISHIKISTNPVASIFKTEPEAGSFCSPPRRPSRYASIDFCPGCCHSLLLDLRTPVHIPTVCLQGSHESPVKVGVQSGDPSVQEPSMAPRFTQNKTQIPIEASTVSLPIIFLTSDPGPYLPPRAHSGVFTVLPIIQAHLCHYGSQCLEGTLIPGYAVG